MKESICIIGGGLSGLTCARQLYKKYNITLFDENNKIGGANRSILYDNKYIDSGVIFISPVDYKHYNILELMNKYNLKYKEIEFSYSICNENKLKYENNINNFLNDLEQNKNNDKLCVKDLLEKYDTDFINNYIKPITTIILACDLNLPINRFYSLLQILPFDLNNKPKWIIPKNGSQELVHKMSEEIHNYIKLNTQIVSVENINNLVKVISHTNNVYYFDKVIFCIRFDIINKIYKTPSIFEKSIYPMFEYYNIETIIHNDNSVFDNNINDFLIFNTKNKILTMVPEFIDKIKQPYVSFLNDDSINNIDKSKIIDTKIWKHIYYSNNAKNIKKILHKLQGKNNIYYSGIEMNNEVISVENAILSGYYVSELLNVKYEYKNNNKCVKRYNQFISKL